MNSPADDLPALLGGPPVRPQGPPDWPRPDEEVLEALKAAYADGSWGKYHGNYVARIEERLAEYHGLRHALTCGSGTFAVELALRALKVGPGDEVILSAYDYPGNFLSVHAIGATPVLVDLNPATWQMSLDRLPDAGGVPRLVALLGGTIGNFPPGTRRGLLRKIGALLGPEDRFLLGTDLVKDPAMIEAAYDDPEGITAEFNRNVLRVINRELGADFAPEAFEHIAFYNRTHEWIEMRLRAQRPVSVLIEDLGLRVDFAAGEELRTEISAKFTRQRVEADFAAAGLALEGWYTDPGELFALSVGRRV